MISSAEIFSGLIRIKNGVHELPTSVIQKVESMVGNLETALLDGFGSELVHAAIAKHVRLLSSMPFVRCLSNSKKTASLWLEVLEKTLRRSTETLQANAALALKKLFSIEHLFDFKQILDRFVQFIRPESQKYARRGFAIAMGSFPVKVTVEFLPLLIDNLIETASLPVNVSENDVECRRNAIQAIISIFQDLLPLKVDEQIVQCMENAFECFSVASGDYSVDSRGDVGSLIREVSLSGMEAYVHLAMQQEWSISLDKVYLILNAVILGCFEKIDNIRDSAGKILDRFIDSNVQFPWQTKLASVIKDRHDDFEWMSAKHTIPLLTNLIEIPEITDTVVLGLAINVGGLTESLVNSATSALTYYLGRAKDFNLILSSLGKIFVEYQRNDRVSVPLLETVNFLIEAGYLSLDWPEQPTRLIFNSVQKEIMKSRNSFKIRLGIKM